MRTPWRRLCLVTLALGAGSNLAAAAEKPAVTPAPTPTVASAAPESAAASLEKELAELDSPSQEVRDRATTDLMVREDLDDADLATALRGARSPEQRIRLQRVALHRFYAGIRPAVQPPDHDAGSLGIQLSDLADAQRRIVRPYQHPALKNPAVLISGTIPGFPAYAYLKPGDLIVAINGDTFTDEVDQGKFAQRIKAMEAGQAVTLDVLRDGKQHRVKLRLDSLHRLNEVSRLCGRAPEQYPAFQNYLQNLTGQAARVPRIHVELPDPPPNANGPAVGVRRQRYELFQIDRRIILRNNRPALPADASR